MPQARHVSHALHIRLQSGGTLCCSGLLQLQVEQNIWEAHLRQMSFSQLYFFASASSEGSMMPPRRRSTRCSVDSASQPHARQSTPC